MPKDLPQRSAHHPPRWSRVQRHGTRIVTLASTAIQGTSSRRKCFGKAKNGTPLYGPCETYTYHPPKNQWGRKISDHRELFKQAQKQAIVEMADPERLAYWQPLFEEQHAKPKQGEKRYGTLRGFVIAQIHQHLKKEQAE